MGLNSLSEIIIIMRYYIENQLPSNILYLLEDKLCESKDEQWIITSKGIYKYVNNLLQLYKLQLSDSISEKNTLSNIKPSEIKWIKTTEQYRLPIKHAIINIKYNIYKLHPESTTSLIVELKDNIIYDYYFDSQETINNHFLIEDINSFLSLLN